MSLKEKLLKNTKIKHTSTLIDSKFFTKKDMIPTSVPMINVALSGTIDGGITPGLTMLAGPSKHFKTGFALLLASAYLKKYPDGIILFYDSEFGTPQSYFETFKIPLDSVVHTPVTDVEELKHDLSVQLKELTEDDKVLIIIDSIGNLASKKETDDALDGKVVADMSRAKALKSLFRIITPKLTLKDIPLVVVNHTYEELGMYPKQIVGGGTGSYYGSDNIWILGRQQDKDDKEIKGYHFVINVEKSRYVKEKSKIPITVSFNGGINRWSGLLEIAVAGKYINKINKGKLGTHVQILNPETGELLDDEYKLSEVNNSKAFWMKVFELTNFAKYIENTYKISNESIIGDDENDD